MKRSIQKSVIAIVLVLSTVSFGIKYSGGSGEPNNPYQIATKADLLAMAAETADYSKSFILTANIDLGRQVFTRALIAPDTNIPKLDPVLFPDVVFDGTQFTGVFEGGRHVISNLTIDNDESSFIGLFGYVGAGGQIRNIRLKNVDIMGAYAVGGLVGFNEGTLTACQASGIAAGEYVVGGLVGYNDNIIISCSAGTAVTDAYKGSASLGGLVGYNSDSAVITSCYATGAVTGTIKYNVHYFRPYYGGDNIGGLVGSNYGDITSCYATGTIRGFTWIGGLVGWNEGSITLCYAAGAVIGTDAYPNSTDSMAASSRVGGLVGNNRSTITSCYATGAVKGSFFVGGLAGENNNGKVIRCYSVGKTKGTSNVGGLCGGKQMGDNYEDTGNFWDVQTSQIKTSEMGIGKTTAQMKTISTFTDAGWDFDETDGDSADWAMPVNQYPQFTTVGMLDIQKCTVTAGKTLEQRSIAFSGRLDATHAALFYAAEIKIDINSPEMPTPLVLTFPINDSTLKKGIYNYTIEEGISKSRLQINTKNKNIYFSAKNVNLTGMACPITVNIQIGNRSAQAILDETIVNGKNPCPLQLMMGVQSNVVVKKYKTRYVGRTHTEKFSAQGIFTTEGDFDTSKPFVVDLPVSTITIPGNSFSGKNGIYKCKNVYAGDDIIVSAAMDTNKCTFTLFGEKYWEIGVGGISVICFGTGADLELIRVESLYVDEPNQP